MKINLDYICQDLNFSNILIDKRDLKLNVVTTRDYFFMIREDEGIDIVTFDNASDVNSLKFYRFDKRERSLEINLDNNSPSFTGREALRFLKIRYAVT